MYRIQFASKSRSGVTGFFKDFCKRSNGFEWLLKSQIKDVPVYKTEAAANRIIKKLTEAGETKYYDFTVVEVTGSYNSAPTVDLDEEPNLCDSDEVITEEIDEELEESDSEFDTDIEDDDDPDFWSGSIV